MAYRFTPWRVVLECAAPTSPPRPQPAPPLFNAPAAGKTKGRMKDRL
ncbi:hypothetical protein ABIC66_002447 [Caulobacter sp. 1776]